MVIEHYNILQSTACPGLHALDDKVVEWEKRRAPATTTPLKAPSNAQSTASFSKRVCNSEGGRIVDLVGGAVSALNGKGSSSRKLARGVLLCL